MNVEERVTKLEKENAVLEYRVQELQEYIRNTKPLLDRMEEMLKELIRNPFGSITN